MSNALSSVIEFSLSQSTFFSLSALDVPLNRSWQKIRRKISAYKKALSLEAECLFLEGPKSLNWLDLKLKSN